MANQKKWRTISVPFGSVAAAALKEIARLDGVHEYEALDYIIRGFAPSLYRETKAKMKVEAADGTPKST